jgi:hypothetical protein
MIWPASLNGEIISLLMSLRRKHDRVQVSLPSMVMLELAAVINAIRRNTGDKVGKHD